MLEILSQEGECSAEAVRRALEPRRELSDSATRTILRRLSEKGFVDFRREGRRYLYRPLMSPQKALAVTMERVLAQLTDTGVGDLVVGMVENDMLSRRDLQRLRERIEEVERREQESDD